MSITTWKKEFYGSLKEASKSDVKALKHGIRKWTGLLPKNLEKHGVFREEYYFITDTVNTFEIDMTTCALCERHFHVKECSKCPINDCCCDGGPYIKWDEEGNPRPMIRVLKKALKERIK